MPRTFQSVRFWCILFLSVLFKIFAHTLKSIPIQTIPLSWTYVSTSNLTTIDEYSMPNTWMTDTFSFTFNTSDAQGYFQSSKLNANLNSLKSEGSNAFPKVIPNQTIATQLSDISSGPAVVRKASAIPWKVTDRLDHALLNMNSFRSESPRIVRREPVVRKRKNLFRNFAFKGVALSVSKSILDVKGVGFGVKIPVTANFPEYDRLIYLPKVVAYCGMNYPFNLRFQLAFSVPAQVAIAVLMMLFKRQKINWSELKASGSVKRVGINWAVNYNKKMKLHSTMSFMLFYMPGMRTVIDLLPIIIVFPAVLVGIWNLVVQLLAEIGFDPLNRNLAKLAAAKQVVSSQEVSEEINSILSTSFSEAWVLVDKWIRRKTPIFGSNIGYNSVRQRLSLGSTVYFDIQPFFPLQNRFKKFSPSPRTKQRVREAARAATTLLAQMRFFQSSFSPRH